MEQNSQDGRTKEWDEWMEIRVGELEKQYESAHVTDLDREQLEQLRRRLVAALGPQSAALLRLFTDKLLAVYSRDVDWFYRRGWEDAVGLSAEIGLSSSAGGYAGRCVPRK